MIGSTMRRKLPLPNIGTIRAFKTSSHHQALPPVLLALVKPLAMVTSALIGRGSRLAWRRLPSQEKMKFKEKYLSRKVMAMTAGTLSGVLGFSYWSHVVVCPYTGRRKFVAFTEEQVARITEAELETIFHEMESKIVEKDHPVYKEIAEIGTRLLIANKDLEEIGNKDWKIILVDDGIENAFVLQTGHIFVHRGMYVRCSDDGKLNKDMLGIIIGHEMAHAILGHTAEKLSMTNLVEACLLVPMALIWAFIPSDGIAFVTHWFLSKIIEIFLDLPFSREMESEADYIGLVMAAKACFDIREGPAFWEMQAVTAEIETVLTEYLDYEDNSDLETIEMVNGLTGYLSTHPSNEQRQKELEGKMEELLKLRCESSCPDLDDKKNPQVRAVNAQEFWRLNKNIYKAKSKAKQEAKQKENIETRRGVPITVVENSATT